MSKFLVWKYYFFHLNFGIWHFFFTLCSRINTKFINFPLCTWHLLQLQKAGKPLMHLSKKKSKTHTQKTVGLNIIVVVWFQSFSIYHFLHYTYAFNKKKNTKSIHLHFVFTFFFELVTSKKTWIFTQRFKNFPFFTFLDWSITPWYFFFKITFELTIENKKKKG